MIAASATARLNRHIHRFSHKKLIVNLAGGLCQDMSWLLARQNCRDEIASIKTFCKDNLIIQYQDILEEDFVILKILACEKVLVADSDLD